MDAVVLAGGRGSRVAELVPEFHKPLLMADGVPMVSRAVDLALEAGVRCPVVVVSPQNAELIDQALGDRPAFIVVQREPLGPGHALHMGLAATPKPFAASNRVLVLLSDNLTETQDITNVARHITAVAVNWVERADAERYTRLQDDGSWVEKVPLDTLDGPPVACWVGPFVGWRDKMTRVLMYALTNRVGNSEVPIGPFLGRFMYDDDNSEVVEVSSIDIGTTKSYGSYRGWK